MNILAIVGSLIKAGMPQIAQAVTDKGIAFVEEKLGVKLKEDMTPDEIETLRERAMAHEEFKISKHYEDIANARAMQIAALQQGDVFSKRAPIVLGACTVIVSLCFFGMVMFVPIPDGNSELVFTIMGFLAPMAGGVLNYFFGSSSGSSEKNKIFSSLMASQRK